MKLLSGAGGGGGGKGGGGGNGGARAPRQERDSLDSKQYANLIDLISEGEIEGLKNGEKSIFLNNTPLQNPDGSYNFNIAGGSISWRNGTQNQDYIPIGEGIEDEKPVGVTVQKATPVVRSITDTNVDAVRVTIAIPQLQYFTREGDIVGDEVELSIDVQYNGGGYSRVIYDKIVGRTADLYQRDYIINIDGAFPVDIKVTRLNNDSSDPNLTNAFQWTSYTEIIRQKLRYPNSALIALRLDAEQFSSIPTRSYLIRGIKVAIPSNATVDTTTGRLIYSGIWNGTFGAAQWCSDPAWILWDLLTSTRYGFGDHIQAAQLDKFAFYAASQYCAELVPNGFGGQEPRFSCNVNIQTAEEAYKLINDMCSVFRAMPYWSAGALTINQDKPADYTYYFTLANVTEEGFTYQGSSRKTRPNVCVVSYLDLESRDIAYEVVEDAESIAKYGVVRTEISAFACTSRGQAYRIGEWLLYSERYESEIVSFTTSVDAGVMVRPGALIKIADPVRAGERRGGRIVSATTTTVTVDSAAGLSSGGVLNVILPNGSAEQRNVTNITGNVFTVSSAFSTAPANNSVWLYGTNDIQTSTWRVLTVQEQDGAKYAISAIAYNSSKYGYVERGTALQQRDITNLNIISPSPQVLTGEEVLYADSGLAKAKIIVSWQPVPGVVRYQVRWRKDSDNWNVVTVERPDYEILDTSPGTYAIYVYSQGGNLRWSPEPAELTFEARGKTAPPSTPTGISLVPSGDSLATLSWNRATELDVILGGKVLIRHSTLLTGATWENSQQIVSAAAGGQTQKQVPLLEGTYLIKFEDDTGNRSESAALITSDLPEPQPRFLVEAIREDQDYFTTVDEMETWDSLGLIDDIKSTLFAGTKTNMQYDAGVDGLIVTNTALGTGEYQFANTFDMGGIFDVNMRRYLATRSYLPNALWDSQTASIDSWTTIDGNAPDRVDALLYVRSTNDNPAATPTWSTWSELSNGLLRGRGFQFKLVATVENVDQNIIVDELGVTVELQQRTEQLGPIESSLSSVTSVTFANPFYRQPVLGFSAYAQAANEVSEIINVSRTGFEINFAYEGAPVARKFTYTAVGYGKEII